MQRKVSAEANVKRDRHEFGCPFFENHENQRDRNFDTRYFLQRVPDTRLL